jgi:hypothetical protein
MCLYTALRTAFYSLFIRFSIMALHRYSRTQHISSVWIRCRISVQPPNMLLHETSIEHTHTLLYSSPCGHNIGSKGTSPRYSIIIFSRTTSNTRTCLSLDTPLFLPEPHLSLGHLDTLHAVSQCWPSIAPLRHSPCMPLFRPIIGPPKPSLYMSMLNTDSPPKPFPYWSLYRS